MRSGEPLAVGTSPRPLTRASVSWLAFAALAVVGFLSILYVTPYGLSAGGDSVAYVGAARNIVEGRGISRPTGGGGVKPLTHFPPLYPLMLAAFEALGVGALEGARLLGAGLFGVNILLVGWTSRAATKRTSFGLIASLVMLLSPTMISLHVWIMSEPLYLALMCSGFLILDRYGRGGRLWHLLVGAALLGMAYLARYVGLALVVTAALAIFFTTGVGWRRKARDTFLFLAVSLAPIALWMVRNILVAGTATNRRLIWHPLPVSYLKRPFSMVWEWLLPFKFTYVALYLMLGITFIVLLWLLVRWRRGRRRPMRACAANLFQPQLTPLNALHLLVYSGLLVFSLSFLDASTPIDSRTTSPLFVSALILIMPVSARAWEASQHLDVTRIALAVTALILATSYSYQDILLVGSLRTDASGYASQGVRTSGTLRAVQDLPADVALYSNEPEMVYFVTGRGAYMVPVRLDAVTDSPNPRFAQDLAQMRENLLGGEAALVLFRTIEVRPDLASVPEMTAGLRVLYAGQDGQILVGPSFP